MSIKAYTNSGAENCSKLEKAADFFLAIPRVLWFGSNVRVIKGIPTHNRFTYLNKDEKLRKPCDISAAGGLKALCDSTSNSDFHLKFIAGIVLGAIFVVASIAASPLLAIGCAFKRAALKEPKALHYHKFVKLFLEKEGLNDTVIEKTHQHNALIERLKSGYTYKVLAENMQEQMKKVLSTSLADIEKNSKKVGKDFQKALTNDQVKEKVNELLKADKEFVKSKEALSSLASRLDAVSTEYVKAMRVVNK